MGQTIAIIGMACRYPDARNPDELWENVLAERRSFRRIPAERLCLQDYFSADPHAPDRVYAAHGAFIEGYEFDRVRFRVTGRAFRATDLTHWLALDVAADALADAGCAAGAGLPRERVGVFVGNTLTGEFSRAALMRLRWPYVRRVLDAALAGRAWPAHERGALLAEVEAAYKRPFAPVGEETLAGGLSNTIAGRICNYFDFKGGGYTVDGACASSLLAIINACTSLAAGDLDAALAGGVDLSVDPFELVGFAKAGALAAGAMRVYDARPTGFWPGEGCGLVALMRYEDALAEGRDIRALIRGWGVSSDGSGGITRPELEGQLIALRRAYERAGYGIDTVGYFEGHGTGTAVGDATELRALSQARRASGGGAAPAALGSIKANIGHTKAAAGVAGLLKAVMTLRACLVPPTTGCETPHPELGGASPALRVLDRCEPWPAGAPRRAGVSAMGFGGINTHLTLEAAGEARPAPRAARLRPPASSAQDAELFLLGAADRDELLGQLARLSAFADRLSFGELADLAAQLEKTAGAGPVRAALVAASPSELAQRLATLAEWVAGGEAARLDVRSGLFFAATRAAPRVGFLFPGQGAPANCDGGMWARRFEAVRELYAGSPPGGACDVVSTATAQPAIARASVAALRVLERLGLGASLAVGHSLGELTALHWAGAWDEEALLRLAAARGRIMAELNGRAGAMLSIGAGPREVCELLRGEVCVAAFNSPRQTVVSGDAAAVAEVAERARARGLACVNLRVSHAFHSPLVAAAAPRVAAELRGEELRPLRRAVFSTVEGALLPPDADLRELLARQVTSPVRFAEAVEAARGEGVGLWIEVGPGHTLRGPVGELTGAPVISLDAGGPSLAGLLRAAGACHALGARLNYGELSAGRLTRPFELDWRPRFFANPCESAPPSEAAASGDAPREGGDAPPPADEPARAGQPPSGDLVTLEVVKRIVAERAELPCEVVRDDSRLLDDLHLNSLTIGLIVTDAARRLNLKLPAAPTDYASATVAEVASALEAAAEGGGAPGGAEAAPEGIDGWVRPFTVELVERPLPMARRPERGGGWLVVAADDHPLGDALRCAFGRLDAGCGVVVALGPEAGERQLSLLLAGARAAADGAEDSRFVLVQHGEGAAAFARTFHLEAKRRHTCVVSVPPSHPRAVEWVVAEALSVSGYAEAHYCAEGLRRVPVLRPLALGEPDPEPLLTGDDVLVVTGGARGITAECALALARGTGARLALFGLSRPDADEEIINNLARFTAAGVAFRYYAVDVTDAGAVRDAVRAARAEFGPVTGFIHGAARNAPQLLTSLDEEAFQRTLAPKLAGARHVLEAVEPERLRLFLAFGSIIARTGLPGEAHYGLANQWLTGLVERWRREHPRCHCLCVEWSVWSGTGMGARIGTVEALARQGIAPITPERGVAALRQLLGRPLPTASAVVMGRFREMPTLEVERPELPFLRFLERPRVYYPGVELIADAEVSPGSDPYLDDHVFQGQRLLPAVMGMEAMAQAAMAMTGAASPPVFEQVSFQRPVVVPESGLTIRVAALARDGGRVEVALRSAETEYQVDHFRATCRFQAAPAQAAPGAPLSDARGVGRPLRLDPARDLYGSILFHGGRFRRLRAYRRLCATDCLAEIAPDGAKPWFGRYLPGALTLGDPGARDAAIHAIQACIPQSVLLPIGVERVFSARLDDASPLLVSAREVLRDGDTFVYDVELEGSDGAVRERWEGLRLREVKGARFGGPWAEELLGPYVERRARELLPGADLRVVLLRDDGAERRARSQRAIEQALGGPAAVLRRRDGKPEVTGGEVSASHAGALTLGLAGRGPLGCDVEPVRARPAASWSALLGGARWSLARVIARESGEDVDAAATRVWNAAECLKKAGAGAGAPLVLAGTAPDGWLLLSSGEFAVASLVARTRDGQRLALALAVQAAGAPSVGKVG